MILNIAVKGQSNAQGTTGPLDPANPSPTPDPARAFERLFTQVGTAGGNGKWVSLCDPMSRDRANSRKSSTGSICPALVNTLLQYSDVERVNVAHYAVSGTAVSTVPGSTNNQNWGPTGALRTSSRLHVQDMLNASGLPLHWLVFVLGETDFYVNLTRYATTYALFPNGYVCAKYPAGYSNPNNLPSMYEMYADLIDWEQQQFPGVKVLLNETGPWEVRSAAEKANGALAQVVQRELAANLPDVYTCGLSTTFSSANGRIQTSDINRVHYSQLGANELGAADAELIYAVETAV